MILNELLCLYIYCSTICVGNKIINNVIYSTPLNLRNFYAMAAFIVKACALFM